MASHLIDGVFKSDKYEWSPAGFVPLKVTDADAQEPLWLYSLRHQKRDPEFTADLQQALLTAGYKPGSALKALASMIEERVADERKRFHDLLAVFKEQHASFEEVSAAIDDGRHGNDLIKF